MKLTHEEETGVGFFARRHATPLWREGRRQSNAHDRVTLKRVGELVAASLTCETSGSRETAAVLTIANASEDEQRVLDGKIRYVAHDLKRGSSVVLPK